jgi:hypothetical protein
VSSNREYHNPKIMETHGRYCTIAKRSKNKCDQASHPVALFRGSLVLPSRRQERRDDGTGPRALTLAWSATFTSTGCRTVIRRTIALQPLRRPAAQLAQRASCRGGRNARATGTRSRALPIFPRQFTLENCQSATGFANIHHSASRENYHVFAEPTLEQNVATRN